jgi:RNA polymerase sigma-70 factor (ECF subfamily)
VLRAFLAAARDGDFKALLEILNPDVVQRTEAVDGSVTEVRGARTVGARARAFALNNEGVEVRAARIARQPGWVSYRDGQIYTTGALTIADGQITRMDIVMNPARIAQIDVTPLDR